jgi:hypothetical protein
MKNGKLKLIPTLKDLNHDSRSNKWRLQGKCQGCGHKLTDKLSIARGYGRGCFQRKVKVAVVLQFIPEEK